MSISLNLASEAIAKFATYIRQQSAKFISIVSNHIEQHSKSFKYNISIANLSKLLLYVRFLNFKRVVASDKCREYRGQASSFLLLYS